MIPAIVLAAGRSSRLGRPKALLQAHADSFVASILVSLREGGIPDAIVIVHANDETLEHEVRRFAPFARTVVNPNAEAGQLSSLVTGINTIDRPAVRGAMVALVDVPLFAASTVRMLLERAARSKAAVVRPEHRGRHGHPVIFMRAAFDAIRHADPAAGAKDALRRLADRIEDVAVPDAGVLEDVDTIEDYRRLFGREPR